jgi:7,8-dihydro-6-hydroxymethylpterin-pyrophosphokinase
LNHIAYIALGSNIGDRLQNLQMLPQRCRRKSSYGALQPSMKQRLGVCSTSLISSTRCWKLKPIYHRKNC